MSVSTKDAGAAVSPMGNGEQSNLCAFQSAFWQRAPCEIAAGSARGGGLGWVAAAHAVEAVFADGAAEHGPGPWLLVAGVAVFHDRGQVH